MTHDTFPVKLHADGQKRVLLTDTDTPNSLQMLVILFGTSGVAVLLDLCLSHQSHSVFHKQPRHTRFSF